MNCPSDDTLRRLLQDPKLNSVPVDIISHLATCSDCRRRVCTWGELTNFDEIFRQSGVGASPPPRSTVSIDNHRPCSLDVETASYHQHTSHRVGNYNLLRRIGSGGCGEVFEALHLHLQRHVALKVLSTKRLFDQESRQRFCREMESIGRLNHPCIIQAYDAGDADGELYLAMELIHGPDVETLARQVSPMSIADACEIVRQAALGVQHAHEQGLIHRDIKPSNLMLSSTGVKVADFGMVLWRSPETEDHRLTASHVIMGTGDYMSPEQSEGAHHVDIRADIYSLGCTLYRLLAGRPPFASFGRGSVMQKLMAHVNQPVPDIAILQPLIPEPLKAILGKLLVKNRQDRFAEPRELAVALIPFCGQSNLDMLLTIYFAKQGKIGVTQVPGLLEMPQSPQATTQPIRLTDLDETRRIRIRKVSLVSLGMTMLLVLILRPWNWKDPRSKDVDQLQKVHDVVQAGARSEIPVGSKLESPSDIVASSRASLLTTPQLEVIRPLFGPTAQLWEDEFGQKPIELRWPRQPDVGESRFDENSGELSIQAIETMRFVKLGDIAPETQEFSLVVDITPASPTGGFGLFFGYEAERGATPRYARFHAIDVHLLPLTPSGQKVFVRSYDGKIDGRLGAIGSGESRNMKLSIPPNRRSFQLHVQLRRHQLPDIRFCDQLCSALSEVTENTRFAQMPEPGPFGLFADHAAVVFTNPKLRRSLP